MNNGKLQVGIIGAGGAGRGAHVPGYRSTGRADVLAVCDVNADAARSFAETLELSNHYGSVEDMLAQEDLDVVSICTSNDAHHPAAMAAIARGLHVFCEKPLAMNFAQAVEMHDAAEAKGVVTGINFTYRTTPAARYIKELADQAIFGDVNQFNIEYYQSYSMQPGRGLEWRFQKKLTGTGALADLGSHATDLAMWLNGGISGARGQMATFIHERPLLDGSGMGTVDVDDVTTFLARYENGATGVVDATRLATGRSNHQRITIYGDKGSLVFQNGPEGRIEVAVEPFSKDGSAVPVPVPSRLAASSPSHVPAFVNTILDGAPVDFPTFADGLRVQEVLEAAEVSHNEDRWVSLPLPR
ncbi:MAG: Gfo/Idh/MocA family oxidoreductase [Chloroflexota bacterium]|nr:Gfo/Idh/MocA family oxidoreductase [Chloroflexota bacterium]